MSVSDVGEVGSVRLELVELTNSQTFPRVEETLWHGLFCRRKTFSRAHLYVTVTFLLSPPVARPSQAYAYFCFQYNKEEGSADNWWKNKLLRLITNFFLAHN